MQSRKNEMAGLLTEVLYALGYCALIFGLVFIATR